MMIRWICLLLFASVTTVSLTAATISTGAASWLVDGNPAVITTTQFNYFAPFRDGNWIGVNSSGVVSSGTYAFTLNIGDLVGMPGTFSLSYGADNSVSWTITNGSLAGTVACLNPNGDCFGPGASPTEVPATLTGTFNVDSILTATVINDVGDDNPMALFAAGSANSIPEPSTLTLVLAAIPLVFLRMQRKSIRPEESSAGSRGDHSG